MNNMDFINEITNSISAELQLKKDIVIRERFEFVGLSHLLDNLEAKRFKKVAVEIDGIYERWYADNGTEAGELVVTFVNELPKFTNDGGVISLKSEIKYF